MTTALRSLLVLSALAVSGCAGYYPYHGQDGVYYGEDYYDGYYGYGYSDYGYGYGHYQPYYYNPYSSYYYSRSSYYYPYYPYSPYYGGGGRHDWDDDDDDSRGGRDGNASDELRRITRPPISGAFPPNSGDPPIIRRAKSNAGFNPAPAPRDRSPSNAGRELQGIDFDANRTPARRDVEPRATRSRPVNVPRPQPRRHAPVPTPQPRLRQVPSPREDRVRR